MEARRETPLDGTQGPARGTRRLGECSALASMGARALVIADPGIGRAGAFL